MSSSVAVLHHAGFVKRVAAFALDYLIITAYLVVLLGVGVGVTYALGPLERTSPLFASPLFLDGIAFLTAILPVILYFALQESSPSQATWGKRKMGLKVVNARGERLSQPKGFVRAVVKFLPWQLAHSSLLHIQGWPFAPEEPTPMVLVGLIMAQVLAAAYVISLGVGKAHRTPYDWVSGAFVIVAR
ncbi:MAG: RDD family protein [Chloroflexi bacterium]|nr:RDD family protein [Chloroflexota bacterium]